MHRLAPVLGLLLLFAAFLGGTHHHGDGFARECAVCAVGQAPAIAPDIAPSAAGPDGPDETCLVTPTGGPRAALHATLSCRAPPSS